MDLTWFFVLVLFLYVILSWFSPDPSNPLVQLLTIIALPILEPLRRLIPPVAGVIDISPIIALFALQMVNNILHACSITSRERVRQVSAEKYGAFTVV